MSETFTVIVTGWRAARADWHEDLIADELLQIHEERRGNVVLRHGKCKFGGVDLIADTVARGLCWRVEEYPAEERDGRILGPARNREMCAAGADLVLGFPGPGSRGTWDCLHWAARYNIPFRGVPLQVGGRR